MSKDVTERVPNALHTLAAVLRPLGRLALAVSGGVDSMTLAVTVGRLVGAPFEVFHAVSPAVPPEATARVRRYAEDEDWQIEVIDTGEFEDPRYIANPANRCFHCKAHLYSRIAERTTAVIAAGTNLDDLSDYRPGLAAADLYRVKHPFVEAGIDKSEIRALARYLGLYDLAELPASPCLASRIETSVPISVEALRRVHIAEQLVSQALSPRTVRCRVRRTGIVLELDADSFAGLQNDQRTGLIAQLRNLFVDLPEVSTVSFAPYVMGSAFTKEIAND